MYFQSYLRGKAFSLIENLPNDEDGFEKAMILLMDAFFQQRRVGRKERIRAKLVDLEKLNLNYRDDGAAEKLMSFILRNKLSSDFMVELSRKLGHNYALVYEILENCVSVHSLLKKGEVLASSEKSST